MNLIKMTIDTNFKGLNELKIQSEYGDKKKLITDDEVEDCVNEMYALFKEIKGESL